MGRIFVAYLLLAIWIVEIVLVPPREAAREATSDSPPGDTARARLRST